MSCALTLRMPSPFLWCDHEALSPSSPCQGTLYVKCAAITAHDAQSSLRSHQVFGGAHKLTQWMTAPSLELLCEGSIEAGKEKASHQKQARACCLI